MPLVVFTLLLTGCAGRRGARTEMLSDGAVVDLSWPVFDAGTQNDAGSTTHDAGVITGTPTANDIDGDGIQNANDHCPSTPGTTCTFPSAPAPTGNANTDGLNHVNWIRSLAGLSPITEDATMSHGCAVHLNYLSHLSADLGSPQLAHDEDLSKSYATAEGNQAGIDSVLAWSGDPSTTLADAVDTWMNSLYHRLPLLDPGFQRAGFAAYQNWQCINYRNGTVNGATTDQPVMWPPRDYPTVNASFGGNEGPCPTAPDPLNASSCAGSGAILTLGFFGSTAYSNVTGTLRNVSTGATSLIGHVYYEGGPSQAEQAGYLQGNIALVPSAAALGPGTFEADITATTNGAPQTYRWRFTTVANAPW